MAGSGRASFSCPHCRRGAAGCLSTRRAGLRCDAHMASSEQVHGSGGGANGYICGADA
jgi:hypothetical protein